MRYLGSLFIPEEDACFCRFEAPSAETVAEANARAALPFARVAAAVPISGDPGYAKKGTQLRRSMRARSS